jgi:hypothetical protein
MPASRPHDTKGTESMKTFILAAAATAAIAAAPAVSQPRGDVRGPAAQVHTRADVEARVQQRFAHLDQNRDGFVTQAEARAQAEAFRAQRLERRAERRAQLFDRLDANHDGSISRAEFENRAAARGGDCDGRRDARAERRAERFARRGGGPRGPRAGLMARFGARAFAAMDSNRDGRVSLAEANAGALAHFDRVDANHDGVVSFEERRSAREAFRARHADGPAR